MTKKNAPDAVSAVRGDDLNTHQGELIMTDSTTSTDIDNLPDVVEFPDVPGPSWATSHDDLADLDDEGPCRLWTADLAAEPFFAATLTRLDTLSSSTGRVSAGQVELAVTIDKNDTIEFIDPQHVREAAAHLLAVAAAFEEAS